MNIGDKQPIRGYHRRGGRPGLEVDFMAVYDAVREAWAGNGDTITGVAARLLVGPRGNPGRRYCILMVDILNGIGSILLV